jgi:hypothetical protein
MPHHNRCNARSKTAKQSGCVAGLAQLQARSAPIGPPRSPQHTHRPLYFKPSAAPARPCTAKTATACSCQIRCRTWCTNGSRGSLASSARLLLSLLRLPHRCRRGNRCRPPARPRARSAPRSQARPSFFPAQAARRAHVEGLRQAPHAASARLPRGLAHLAAPDGGAQARKGLGSAGTVWARTRSARLRSSSWCKNRFQISSRPDKQQAPTFIYLPPAASHPPLTPCQQGRVRGGGTGHARLRPLQQTQGMPRCYVC